MKYKLHHTGTLILRDDGACIPTSLDNRDYVEYTAWLAKGNVPDPADAPPSATIESIAMLERTDMIPRAVREFMLGSIKKDALLAGQDPMLLPAYVKLKNRDDEIKLLRAKL